LPTVQDIIMRDMGMTISTGVRSYPLALVRENQTVQVVNVTGGRNLLRRLLALGIGMAHQILVKEF